jgi:hypothetical protein
MKLNWNAIAVLFYCIIVWLAVLFLSGCTTATMTFPDGRHFSYHSNIFDKKFSEMTFYPDGSFCLVGYQSDATSAIKLAETAIMAIK